MDGNQFITDLNAIFSQLKAFAISYLPKFLMALLIFVAGLILARLLKFLVNRVIDRFDRYIRSRSQQQNLKQVGIDPSTRLIGEIVYWIVLIIFITAATEILGLPVITTWLAGIVNYLPNLLLAAVILFSGIVAGRFLRGVINAALSRSGMALGEVPGKVTQYAIIAVSALIAVTQIGVELEILSGIINIVLAAILFGAALAFGLGARTSVGNILACYYLKERYHEGDRVSIKGMTGKVYKITATSVGGAAG